MKKYTKGFTLIELLVVIAIIGILSSVVLVSLNSARNKGNDAKIQADLSGVRAAMEVYYSDNGGYSLGTTVNNNSCSQVPFDDGKISPYLTNKTAACVHNGTASEKATKYAIAATLPSELTTAWCVDSAGKSQKKSGLSASTPLGAITNAACN